MSTLASAAASGNTSFSKDDDPGGLPQDGKWYKVTPDKGLSHFASCQLIEARVDDKFVKHFCTHVLSNDSFRSVRHIDLESYSPNVPSLSLEYGHYHDESEPFGSASVSGVEVLSTEDLSKLVKERMAMQPEKTRFEHSNREMKRWFSEFLDKPGSEWLTGKKTEVEKAFDDVLAMKKADVVAK